MRKKKNIIASLDFNSEEIRLLIQKKKWGKVNTLVQKNFKKDEFSFLKQELERYHPQEVILLLPRDRVIVRDVTLPLVDKSKIKSMLRYELDGNIPYQMDQVTLDYILLNKSRQQLKLKVFIMPKSLYQDLNVIEKAGITITRLLPGGLALIGYLHNRGLHNRLVNFKMKDGRFVVFSDIENYFSEFYDLDYSFDLTEIEKYLKEDGVEIHPSDLVEIEGEYEDLKGAYYFYQKYPEFNLLDSGVQKRTNGKEVTGIICILIFMLFINFATMYVKYLSSVKELEVYQEKLKILTPKMEEVKNLSEKIITLSEEYDTLQQAFLQNRDYLIWLRELHLLLQEDTNVNILVFEDNILKELHGRAPFATRVSAKLQDSPYFGRPELTSPIIPKTIDGKKIEEFSITALLLNPRKEGEKGD